ncbi:MAG: S-methyl-5'-thioadenosine phosphorylase [Nitrospirae bacterium]|nr:S-methyl-5'-thioadenosine phosphorylase [Nitrospirota bacterium]MBF0540803.1 S-methyl-5'-thioadenosine phosphorylase [Nitrospirota bacterium]
MTKIGIIGGSGIYNLLDLALINELPIETPYGKPSSHYSILQSDTNQFVFLNRHGKDHDIAPHKINYRANIWGFKEIGIKKIISLCAVGGINKSYVPGDIVFPNQIIDVTSDRHKTFYDDSPLYHIDFSNPFCPQLRDYFIKAASEINQFVYKSGTYICTNGPRLETSAEIKYYSLIGADMVGMTGMPEAVLARELELCYASCAIITNFAAGIKQQPLTVNEVITTMKQSEAKLNILLKQILISINENNPCTCNNVLKDASIN